MSRAAAALAGLALTVSGCSLPWTEPQADEPEVRVDELAAHPGGPCPAKLPTGEDPGGHGFGVDTPADELPSFLDPEEAWVCRYDPVETGRSAQGAVFDWVREDARPADVPARDLEQALGELALPDDDDHRVCTADLGPRWLVVYSHGGDLTGVVVDDYGCGDVRLTDEPFVTAPGDPGQEGTVGGVLDGGPELMETLGIGLER